MNAKRLGKLLAFAGAVIGLGTTLGLSEVLADRGLAQDDQGIKPFVPNGTYASHVTGYIPLGPSGSLVPLAAAGHITYSADGTKAAYSRAQSTVRSARSRSREPGRSIQMVAFRRLTSRPAGQG